MFGLILLFHHSSNTSSANFKSVWLTQPNRPIGPGDPSSSQEPSHAVLEEVFGTEDTAAQWREVNQAGGEEERFTRI